MVRPSLVSERELIPDSTIPSPAPTELEAIAVEVAALAARTVRRASEPVVAVATKSTPTDVVTALDLEVEALIRSTLAERTPGASIVGEEHDRYPGTTSVGWVVDPIDGTVNLLYDLPVISVSLAATIDGNVVAGAVADVVLDEVFSAAIDRGARRNGAAVTTSHPSNMSVALVATGFSYSAATRAAEAERLLRVLPSARDVRCFGSAALHLCWEACGRIDGYYQRGLKPWDYAAGALIASEAGATVELPSDSMANLVVAASPDIFTPLRDLVT